MIPCIELEKIQGRVDCYPSGVNNGKSRTTRELIYAACYGIIPLADTTLVSMTLVNDAFKSLT